VSAGRAIVADVGGTNARFASVDDAGALYDGHTLATREHDGPLSALARYRELLEDDGPLAAFALAVASPVGADRIELTNADWSFSRRELVEGLAPARVDVLNDFAAVAQALTAFGPEDLLRIGEAGPEPAADAPRVALGPGTGLGVAALVPCGSGWQAVATEGGHATCPARDEQEAAVLRLLRLEFGHVSVERCVSGAGLAALYRSLAELQGVVAEPLAPAEISARALSGECRVARDALELLCRFLATAASDLALSYGARGGVYLGGGILPRMPEFLQASGFRRRFEDKGRFSDYLAAVPTYLITAEEPGLRGLAARVAQRAQS
jgi:glucokinase